SAPPLLVPALGPPTSVAYAPSLHDALPISVSSSSSAVTAGSGFRLPTTRRHAASLPRRTHVSFEPPRPSPTIAGLGLGGSKDTRSEEHTSELQSRGHLVCRLLLEKKKEPDRSRESRVSRCTVEAAVSSASIRAERSVSAVVYRYCLGGRAPCCLDR